MDAGVEEEISSALMRVALAADGFFLGLGLAVVAIRTWLRFSFHHKALRCLEKTPSLPHISDLLVLLEDHREQTDREGIIFSSKASSGSSSLQSNPFVIIRGKVTTSSALESQFFRNEDGLLSTENSTSEKAVIVQRTQTCLCNEWRSLLGWSSDWRLLLGRVPLREQITVSMRKIPFVLTDGDGFHGNSFAHIDMDQSKHELPLTTVYHQLIPVQGSPYTLLQALFGRGYPVAILDKEQILPLGKEITAVGILDRNVDGQPVIKSSTRLPYFLTELTGEQMMIELATNTKVFLWTGIIISTCAVGVLSYAFYRNWCRYNNWKLDQERRHEEEIRHEQDRSVEEQIPDGELCIICLHSRRGSAFLPCGHLVCCVLCAQNVQDINSKCPMCRHDIYDIVRIYET